MLAGGGLGRRSFAIPWLQQRHSLPSYHLAALLSRTWDEGPDAPNWRPGAASLVVRALPRAACRFNRLSARGEGDGIRVEPVARSPLSHPKKNCSCATRAPRGGNSCANSRSSSSPLTLPWTRTAPSTSARFAQVEEEHLRMRSLGNRPTGSGEDPPDGLVLLDQGGAQLGQPRRRLLAGPDLVARLEPHRLAPGDSRQAKPATQPSGAHRARQPLRQSVPTGTHRRVGQRLRRTPAAAVDGRRPSELSRLT